MFPHTDTFYVELVFPILNDVTIKQVQVVGLLVVIPDERHYEQWYPAVMAVRDRRKDLKADRVLPLSQLISKIELNPD